MAKANQPELLEYIQNEFLFYNPLEIYINKDLRQGRIEIRTFIVIIDFQFIDTKNKWKNLDSTIKIENIREFKNSDKAIKKLVDITVKVYRIMQIIFK